MLELPFGYALKMRLVMGLVLETKDVDKGNLSECYDLGKRLSQELAKHN